MKKGQGLSLNTIIIAAIVLIVLIVLWAIFTGRMGTFTKGVVDKTDNVECPDYEYWKQSCGAGEIIVPVSAPVGKEGLICCRPAVE